MHYICESPRYSCGGCHRPQVAGLARWTILVSLADGRRLGGWRWGADGFKNPVPYSVGMNSKAQRLLGIAERADSRQPRSRLRNRVCHDTPDE